MWCLFEVKKLTVGVIELISPIWFLYCSNAVLSAKLSTAIYLPYVHTFKLSVCWEGEPIRRRGTRLEVDNVTPVPPGLFH